jgi:internalin A
MDWKTLSDILPRAMRGENILSLVGRGIDRLPPEIGQLKNLTELHLYNNNLSELPPEIGELTNLTILGVGHNKLINLPSEIGNLKNLRELYLENNELASLPNELSNLTDLDFLDVTSNPLPLPPEMLDKGDQPEALLNYYFSVAGDQALISGAKPLSETKVLIVGQGGVGKTSLVKRLLLGKFSPGESKTEGIAITRWEIISNNQPLIKLNVWDFGGQEIMHATHQFFLTKRSLYVLVLDSRLTQEENRVEYWLKIIQSFGGDSPVLIAGNKTDQHPLDIDRTGLGKKYPSIVGIVDVSAATGAGVEVLKAEIARQVAILPHVHDLLPQKWFIIKKKLERLGLETNFITQDDYQRICCENDVGDEVSQRTLIGFLHDLGVILHFQDDPRLEALGILNPQWVTNGVYKILNSHDLFQNRGVLTLPMLNSILDLPEYPSDKRLFIVDMMKKFELCYEIESDKEFLIPDLLPKDEPFTGNWDGALVLQYHYNVLPSSIISRFIVRMNAFIYKTIWRSGVVLKSNGNVALVKADAEDRKIYIFVSGDATTKSDFLSSIRIELKAIHKTITKIETREKLPVPGYPEVEPVDFTFLLQCERDERETIPVQSSNGIIDISVQALLNGIRPSKKKTVSIFISYSHSDKIFVNKIAGNLLREGCVVWWDFDKLKGGQNWQKEIEKAIFQCQFFLVVLSAESVNAEWVANETSYAIQKEKPIIPLYLKPCEIPLTLINKQYIDFEKQNFDTAYLQLIEIVNPRAVKH